MDETTSASKGWKSLVIAVSSSVLKTLVLQIRSTPKCTSSGSEIRPAGDSGILVVSNQRLEATKVEGGNCIARNAGMRRLITRNLLRQTRTN